MRARVTSLVVFALLVVGCGGSAAKAPAAPERQQEAPAPGSGPPAPPPPAADAPAPQPLPQGASAEEVVDDRERSVRDAVAEVERAAGELKQAMGHGFGEASEPGARDSSKAKPLGSSEEKCASVCRAFESLVRSAAGVCRLEQGERCRRVNTIVGIARDEPAVRSCGCRG